MRVRLCNLFVLPQPCVNLFGILHVALGLQLHDEGRSLAQLALYSDTPAHHFNQVLADAQP